MDNNVNILTKLDFKIILLVIVLYLKKKNCQF